MTSKEEYAKKCTSPDKVARLVKDEDWVDYGFINAYPFLFDRALADRVGELKGVKIRSTLSPQPIQCIEKDPTGESFWLGDFHQGVVSTKYASMDPPRANYHVMNFSEVTRYYREDMDVDMAILSVTPMNSKGYFNFGTQTTYSKALMEKAKIKIVEVNESMPWAYGGYDECIHVSDVDYIIENSEDNITEIKANLQTEKDKKIAENVVSLIPKNGPTLQVGIGTLPDMLLRLFPEFGIKDIGIHTEMVTQAMIETYEAGYLTNKLKSFLPGKCVWSFAFGPRKLYDWIDENPFLAAYPVDFTNNPYVIALNNNMVSLNATLEVDLQGQACSESIGTFNWTGTGGQLDFAYGTYLQNPRGINPYGIGDHKSILTINSTYTDRGGKERSSISPILTPGAIVTTPRSVVSYLVSEWGIAYLKGKSIPERCLEIINNVAHPDYREWLTDEAINIGWLPKTWANKVFVP